MDIDAEKLAVVGGLAQRMVAAAGLPIRVVLTGDRRAAIAGAQFVVTQFRVGGLQARARDERIPLQFGVIGQETTGPGGFMKALRTIPVVLEIAREIRELAPEAWLINFTNPAGIVTEAVARYGEGVRAVGLCNVPITMRNTLAAMLGAPRETVTLDYVGLNHLSWARRVLVRGQDVTRQLLDRMEELMNMPNIPAIGLDLEAIRALGMIPSPYLRYYYARDAVLAKQLKAEKTRAEEVMAYEAQLLELYRNPELREKPALLEKRGGAYYSDAACALMAAIWNDAREVHIVNVVNSGATPDLPYGAVVEVPAVVGRDRVTPLAVGRLEPAIRGLVQQVKAYEELTVEAAVTGSRDLALQALIANPLVPSVRVAREMLPVLLEASRPYLPQFFPEGRE